METWALSSGHIGGSRTGIGFGNFKGDVCLDGAVSKPDLAIRNVNRNHFYGTFAFPFTQHHLFNIRGLSLLLLSDLQKCLRAKHGGNAGQDDFGQRCGRCNRLFLLRRRWGFDAKNVAQDDGLVRIVRGIGAKHGNRAGTNDCRSNDKGSSS